MKRRAVGTKHGARTITALFGATTASMRAPEMRTPACFQAGASAIAFRVLAATAAGAAGRENGAARFGRLNDGVRGCGVSAGYAESGGAGKICD